MSASGESDMKKMAVIGSAGVGKSSLCNVLAGLSHDDNAFPVSDELTSCTYKTTGEIIEWRGTSGRVTRIHLIDTPGLNNEDSGGDNYNIDQMVDYLKEADYVNVFLLVINGCNPRFDNSLISMLKVFQRMFGKKFLQDNAVLAISKWPFDKKSIKKRGQKDGQMIDRLNRRLQELQFIDADRSIPVIFIDSHYDSEDEDEEQKFNEELKKLYTKLIEYPALACNTFRAVNVDDNKLAQLPQGRFSVWRIGGDSNKWFGLDEDNHNGETSGTMKSGLAAKELTKVAAGTAPFADKAIIAALKTGANTGKVLGGMGGGLGIAFGAGEMGFAIYSLITGSATLKTVEDIHNAILEARDRPLVRITQRELVVLDKAATDISLLVKEIKKYHEQVNGSKTATGGVSVVGGGLTIAGIFFPPLLIAGVAASILGASFSFMASMFELSLTHKEKLKGIMDGLVEVQIVVKEVNSQADDRAGEEAIPMQQWPISDDTLCIICNDATINARFLPCGHDNFCLGCARRILGGGAIQEVGPQEPRCPLCRDFAFVVEPHTRPTSVS